jgi:hypothetical protein
MSKILSNNLDQLAISASGSSHTTVSTKNNGLDLSCGTFIDDQPQFDSFADKVLFYRNKFSISTITTPQVSWTHDFTNIPIYRELFPNSKILVVTQESSQEKLAITILQQLKNTLDPNVNSAVTAHNREQYESRWKESAINKITEMIGDKTIATMIAEDKFNVQYKSIITYVTLLRMIGY